MHCTVFIPVEATTAEHKFLAEKNFNKFLIETFGEQNFGEFLLFAFFIYVISNY